MGSKLYTETLRIFTDRTLECSSQSILCPKITSVTLSYLLIWTWKVNCTSEFVIISKQVTANNTWTKFATSGWLGKTEEPDQSRN